MADDLQDSKTAGVGRKRVLQSFEQYRDTANDGDSSDEDRQAKRVKELHEPAYHLGVEDTMMSVDGSPYGHSPPMDVLSKAQDQAEKHSMEVPRMNGGNEIGLAPNASLAQGEPEAPQLHQPKSQTLSTNCSTGWNSGVQAGLRTSFGSRAQSRRMTTMSSTWNDIDGDTNILPPSKQLADTGLPPNQAPQDDDEGNPSFSDSNDESLVDGVAIAGNNDGHPQTASDLVPRVEELSPNEQAQLTPEELRAYQKSYSAYLQANKAQRLEAYLQGEAAPFKLLTRQEQTELSKKGLRAYLKALKSRETYQRLDVRTAKADEVLRRVQKWPLPIENSDIAKSIADGETFYPRAVDATPLVWQSRQAKFILREVFDGQGLPIDARHFTFNQFAPKFLRDNQELWGPPLNKTMLEKAFNFYINKFYQHVIHHAMGLSLTSKAQNALTLDEAKQQAKLLSVDRMTGSEPSNEMTSSLATRSLDISSSTESIQHHTAPQRSPIPAHADVMDGSIHHVRADSNTEAVEDAGAMDLGLSELDLALQRKYFPLRAGDPTQYHCISCSKTGHGNLNCPDLSCTLCGSAHSNMMCPQRYRCMKCYAKGHNKAQCPEKLARAAIEAVFCNICGSKDHLEMACHYIWRSYDSRSEEIKKVRDIPVHCYCCGGSGHYGPECGLHRGSIRSGGVTWSKANRKKYIDATSQNRALSAGVDYSIPSKQSKKGYSIKGNAKNPINLDGSDDESSFIRPKVNNPPQHGHIRFGGQAGQGTSGREPNAPGDYRPSFGRNSRQAEEPERYGREHAFSRPPIFNENSRRYDDAEARRSYPSSRRDYFPDPPSGPRGGSANTGVLPNRGGNPSGRGKNKPLGVNKKPKRKPRPNDPNIRRGSSSRR